MQNDLIEPYNSMSCFESVWTNYIYTRTEQCYDDVIARTFSLLFAVGVGVPRSDALLKVAEEVVQWHAALWATRRVPVANTVTSRRTQRFMQPLVSLRR